MIINKLTQKHYTGIKPYTPKFHVFTTGITPDTRKFPNFTTGITVDTREVPIFTTALGGSAGVNMEHTFCQPI